MTGMQLILAFAIIIVATGLIMLVFGKEGSPGSIKILGIEMTATSALLAIALGQDCFFTPS